MEKITKENKVPLLFKIDVSELEILHIKLLNNENMCHHLNDCGQVEVTNSHGMNSNSKVVGHY